jgi:hypothetical protein
VFLRGFEHKACAERTFDLKEAQMTVSKMLRTHPKGSAEEALARCVEECFACAAICTACADACLGEETVANLVRCIRTDLDCADICAATGSILARQTERDAEIVRSLLQSCVAAPKSVRLTPSTTNTAGSALRHADGVSKPAQTCSASAAEPEAPVTKPASPTYKRA